MGTGIKWEDEWEEEKKWVIGGQGRRMVTEDLSIGEEAAVKETSVTG